MTGDLLAGLLAVGGACGYAGGAVAQQQAASAGYERNGRAYGIGGLLAVFKQRVWLLGLLLDGAGFLLEFLALRAGSLAIVQPLLVCGLLAALAISAVVTRHRITARETGAALLVCASLSGFLAAARPVRGTDVAVPSVWIGVGASVGVAVAVLVFAARRFSRSWRALALATAAGLVNGLFAGLAKLVGIGLGLGLTSAVTGTAVLGLLVAGVVTLTLAAAAFQAGAPSVAVSALFVSEPVAGLTFGAVLFSETVRHSPAAMLLQGAALAGCIGGIAVLSTSDSVLAVYKEASNHGGPATVGD